MSKLETARRIYRRRGLPGLVRAARVKAARVVYPGDLPEPKRRRRPTARPAAAPAPAAPPTSASEVSHTEALQFFERRRPTYERLSAAVRPYLDLDGVVLDVGANVGYFTKVLGETTGFRGTVHLYEPIPHLAELCTQTLAGVPFTAVVHPYGLSDADGSTDIYLARDGNLGWNTLVAEKATAQQMTPLAIELRRFDPGTVDGVPGFVKIDVEGAEHLVLGGLLEALETWSPRPVLLCEIGWGTGHPDWDAELAVFDRLAGLGYRTVTLEGDDLDIRALTRTTDVLLLPEGRDVAR